MATPAAKWTGRNEELLTKWQTPVQRLVRRIAEYDDAPLSTGTRGPAGDRNRRVMDLVMQYAPDYVPSDFSPRQAVKKEFSQAGVTGRNITAIDTAYSHIGYMYDMAQALQPGADSSLVNKVVNAIGKATGKPEVNNLDMAKQAVSDELARAFKGANVSDHEIEAWQQKFSSAGTPAQIQGAIETAHHLLQGRIDAVKFAWKRDMRQDYQGDFLSPANQAKHDYIISHPLGAPGGGGHGGGEKKTGFFADPDGVWRNH